MEHIRKYVIAYIILAFVIGVIVGALPWSKWFAKEGEEPIRDANGKPTGRYAPRNISASARMHACCSWGGGFIGSGCKYPITSSDNVSTCTIL